MNGWFVLLLFPHVVAAIGAYGPTFAFPLIAAAGLLRSALGARRAGRRVSPLLSAATTLCGMDRDPPLPGGTVTLLFTDIESSTRLLSELGDAYADLLAEHRRVVRDAFTAHGGVEVDTQGDSFFYAFPSARGAIQAAAEAQRALHDRRTRIRIGIHTGEPLLTDEGYVGIDVHRAARIMGAGHGGQTLISASTRDLLTDDVPLSDLGEHRLKDLSAPQRLWQLGTDEFPPLRTLHQTNLPVQATPLIGRLRELAEAETLLREHRLLTMTGPGGSGKTRLGLQLAAQMVEEFPEGVWWVPLGAVDDHRLVLPTIALALGAAGSLPAYLRSKRLLLVLDNLEQVIECASELSGLLVAAADIKLLVTSRAPLHIDGEAEYAVEPLAESECVSLFVDRASREEPRDVVLEICRRLDCLPLAVELAAARTALLPADQLLARLDRRLALLTGGRRDAPSRQRTLRATIEWSHELLSPEEQTLFARLGVFAGSFSLDAAEAITGADLDTLQSLIEKSLVRRWPSGRYGMLETIAEFAHERLAQDPGAAVLRLAHAEFFLALAERVEPLLDGSDQARWLDLLEQDHPNLRAALARSLDAGRVELVLRLTAALRPLWVAHGQLTEGRRWIDAALDGVGDRHPVPRARVLSAGALLAVLQSHYDQALPMAVAALALGRQHDLPVVVVTSLLSLGRVRLSHGQADAARSLMEEALALANTDETAFQHGIAIFNLAYLALSTGDLSLARTRMQEALGWFHATNNEYGVARALAGLGATALRRGEMVEAAAYLRDSLARSHAVGNREGAVWAMELLASALASDDAAHAARLLGAAESLRAELGTQLEGGELATHEATIVTLRVALGEEAFTAAVRSGQALDRDALVSAEVAASKDLASG